MYFGYWADDTTSMGKSEVKAKGETAFATAVEALTYVPPANAPRN